MFKTFVMVFRSDRYWKINKIYLLKKVEKRFTALENKRNHY